MTGSVTLALVVGALMGTGVYLLLARSTIRSLLGLLLMSNGINLLFLMASGPSGAPPILGLFSEEDMTDPVPQAMALTAIVITLAMTAFLLALAHRDWHLSRTDVLTDDTETHRIVTKASLGDTSDSDFRPGTDPIESDSSETSDQQGEPGEEERAEQDEREAEQLREARAAEGDES